MEMFTCHAREIVKPLAARESRKRAMEAELVAHLWAIWEEEAEKGPQRGALDGQVLRRFGDAGALRRELQASVGWWERIVFVFLVKEKEMRRLLGLVGILAVLFGMALVLPAMAQFNMAGLAFSGVAMMVGTAVVVVGLGMVAFGVLKRSVRTA